MTVGLLAVPLRSALSLSAEASEPACGSVRAKAPISLPASMPGSQRDFCSSVPQAMTGYCDRMWTDSETASAMSA